MTLCLASCGDDDRYETSHQEITFQQLNVRQVSDSAIEAGKQSLRGQTERFESWQATMATYATAGLRVRSCRDSSCPAGCALTNPSPVTNDRIADGSAILTSHTRLLTAHHVSRGYPNITAVFAQPYLKPDESAPDEEMDYLLAQRLWSLGLIDFATTTATAPGGDAATLRRWDYRTEPGADFEGTHQRDLASLVPVGPQTLNYAGSQVSYSSTIYGPGMLFGHFAPHSIDESLQGFVPLANEQELWLTQYNTVPTEWMAGRTNLTEPDVFQWRQILSRPGYSAENGVPLEVGCFVDEQCVWDGNDVAEMFPDYRGCYRTSNDAEFGSSGGGVLTYAEEYGIPGSPDLLRHIGALQGASDTQGPSWSPDYAQQFPDDENYVIFSSTPEAITPHLEDDFYDRPAEVGGGGPPHHDVEIYQPGSSVPMSCNPSTDPDCRNVRPFPGDDIGKDGQDFVTRNCQDALFPSLQSSNPDPDTLRVAQGFAVGIMGETSKPLPLSNRFDPVPGDEDRFLSTVEMICAPWSEAQWSVHWQDLVFTGWERPETVDGLAVWSPDALARAAASPYNTTNLSSWLPTAYESYPQRNTTNTYYYSDYVADDGDLPETSGVEHDLLRPVSMQMCPPGYALEGLDLIVRDCSTLSAGCEDSTDIVVRGIEALRCVKIPYDDSLEVPHDEQQLRVPTSHDAGDNRLDLAYDASDFRYEFGGETVQVEQQLGTPVNKFDGLDQPAFITCPAGFAIAGMISNGDPLQTTAFDIYNCISLPTL